MSFLADDLPHGPAIYECAPHTKGCVKQFRAMNAARVALSMCLTLK